MMGNWEFLLQKEGEQNWQKINQPTWKMEAGKYRVVGIGDRAQVNVEISLTYITTESGKIKRCTRKRSRSTNSEGLVLMIPYTNLKAGKWEISVSYNLTSESESSAPETVQLLVGQQEVAAQRKNNATQENSSPFPHHNDQPASQFKITLDQDNFVRKPREKIFISGWVEARKPLPASLNPRLHYELRQPQTGKILLEFQQNLLEEKIPLSFSYTLDLPRELETDLILGEVILEAWGKSSPSHNIRLTLANKLFKIKTFLNREKEGEVAMSSSAKAFDQGEHPELLNVLQNKVTHTYQPAGSQVLPPKINRTTGKKAVKDPQLPQFFRKKKSSVLTIRELAPNNKSAGKLEKDLEKGLNSPQDSVSNYSESAKVNEHNLGNAQDFEEVLKARFWSHLNSLAGDLDSPS